MEIFYFFAGLTILGLAGYGLQIWSVRAVFRKRDSDSGCENINSPPVSILKPMKGLDDNLFDNLESFCMLDYPEYEIIFSLQDHNDPAYKVANKIKEKHQNKDISIVVERCNQGLNPKVNNLIPAYRVSKYEHILISDSNVVVGKDYLKEIVKPMEDPDVGLVSNMIRGVGGRTIGSLFENLHLNSFIIGSVCFLDKFLKMPCVVGKSMLMRKNDLEAIGGLRSVKDLLAEDYIIGEKMHKNGKKVILSNHIINNVNEYWGLRRFLNRHTRWGRLRWKIGGVKYLSELIGNPVFISCIPMFILEPSKLNISFALLTCLIKIIGDFYLGKKTAALINPFVYLLSPIKDIIIGFIWVVPILSNTVVWRGNRYTIGKDSILLPYTDSGMWAWRYRLVDAIRTKIALFIYAKNNLTSIS